VAEVPAGSTKYKSSRWQGSPKKQCPVEIVQDAWGGPSHTKAAATHKGGGDTQMRRRHTKAAATHVFFVLLFFSSLKAAAAHKGGGDTQRGRRHTKAAATHVFFVLLFFSSFKAAATHKGGGDTQRRRRHTKAAATHKCLDSSADVSGLPPVKALKMTSKIHVCAAGMVQIW
jgi:hypothetical protein